MFTTPATAAVLLIELARRGIELRAVGGLRFRPRSAMTRDLADRLAACKAEFGIDGRTGNWPMAVLRKSIADSPVSAHTDMYGSGTFCGGCLSIPMFLSILREKLTLR